MFENPGERAKLDANPALIPSMVSETLRWQTPLSYMRRTATRDVELGGKTIRKGDRVAMWYAAGNRDAEVIENPYEYRIDRPNVRRHLAFGFGIHRCLGNRLAEMQLRILWEEILQRFPEIHVHSLERVPSAFSEMQVSIPRRL
jgi:cytochrome P450